MTISIDTKYIRIISSRLRNFKQKNTHLYNASCCFCGDSQKNTSKARLYIFEKKGGLFAKCHNCGIGTSLGNLIKQVDSSLHKEYVLERYKSGESGYSNFKAPTFNIPAPRFDKVAKEKNFEYAEWVSKLPKEHFCLIYCTNRRFSPEMIDNLLFTPNYKKFCDALFPNHGKEITADARLVIPFYDKYNTLIGVSGRALENSDYKLRYVTMRTTDSQEKLIYGMDRVNTNELVKIVEGPIDSMFLSNCVGSGDSALSVTAKKLIDMGIPKDNILLCPDREPRNREIVNVINKFINENFRVCLFPNNMDGKDINEFIINGYSQEQLEQIILKNSHIGLRLRMEFSQWKKI